MKIVIIDDELEIRAGLAHMLDNLVIDGVRLEVLDTAGDALAALDLLNSHEADILITDVRMPEMDGLSLCEIVRYRYPNMQVIILSGYGDFEYVRKAVRLGTIDYLLKPVEEAELHTALRHAVKQSNHKLRKSRTVTREVFESYGSGYKVALCLDLDDIHNERALQIGGVQTLTWLMQKIVGELADELDHICMISDTNRLQSGNLMLGIVADSYEQAEQISREFCHRFQEFWTKEIKMTASFGVSQPFAQPYQDVYPYDQACMALFGRVLHGPGIYYQTERNTTADAFKMDLNPLRTAWETANLELLNEQVKLLLENLLASRLEVYVIKGIEILFLSQGMSAHHTAMLISKLFWMRSAEEMKQWVFNEVNAILGSVASEKLEGQVLVAAKRYIREHLHMPLTLSDVSKAACVSPHHLSHLFSEKAGVTFVEYMTELRVEEAKRLLQNPGAKIYEVGEQVGYQNWKHFSRVFKEVTGVNPNDYKKKYSG
ncbi:response regulator transcription factor [Paenibacillus eucommiae]|uniref:Two-component system response regulator YesN n=1 Tax=Paenibacillus eucommiae TaxID=1355755 RepID=A0ABS4IXH6_9BACL|nr:response regulator [Paenibacillus eucommiae]MBP1992268.1 two-component system response regulator YesN [Paenibacillus eucommiae]